MAGVLVLDWDGTSCLLVAAESSREGVELRGAAVWKPDEDLSPGHAESLGKKLREFLAVNGLKGTSLLVCVGRERVVLKEIAHPVLPPQEEPALVRFQATKDLAEAPEAVVVDYTALPEPAATGQRHSLAVIIRRDILTSMQQLCRAAGLKLLGVVPRPFGAGGSLQLARMRLGKPPEVESAPQAVATLFFGPRWVELNLLAGANLLFSRSLGAGPTLLAEVRRNLVVFAHQPNGTGPRPDPQAIYLVGPGQHAASAQTFQDALDLPAFELDFLTEYEKSLVPADYHSTLAASLGLVQFWSQKLVPINLASPREPAPVVDHGRRRRVMAGALAALLLLGGWAYGQSLLASKKAEIKRLEEDKEDTEAKFKRLQPERDDLEALKEWQKGAIRWIDELYDLIARFPRADGFRLTRMHIDVMSKPNPKDAFAARMTIQGIVPVGKEGLVHQFLESMRDPHLHAHVERFRGQSFTIRVDVAGQPPKDYLTRFALPAGRGSSTWQDHKSSGGQR